MPMPSTASAHRPANTSGTSKLACAISSMWPMPTLAATVSENHRADERQRDRHLQGAEEVRQRARDADLEHDIPAVGSERAQYVLQLRLQGRQSGGDVDDDGEEGDQERSEDGGRRADAEPQHQDRHHGHFRHAVEADHDRIQAVVDGLGPADDQAEQQAESHRNAEPGQRRPQGLQGVDEQRAAELGEGGEDQGRRRQHVGGDTEHPADRLPEQEAGHGHHPRRQLLPPAHAHRGGRLRGRLRRCIGRGRHQMTRWRAMWSRSSWTMATNSGV